MSSRKPARISRWIILTSAVSACAVLGGSAVAADRAARKGTVAAAEYRSHIAYLASDELEGRGIGQPGIDKAAEYIAGQFKKAGLEPGGSEDSYFQPFDLKFWSKIGPKTRLAVKSGDGAPADLKLGTDFTPLPWTDTGEFSGDLVFVGYGIDHGDNDYDDYAKVEVKGKVVLMLRYEPTFLLEDPADPTTHSRHAQFRLKAQRAADRDAAAVIVVDPDDGKGKDALYKFGHGAAGGFGIPMLHCTRAAANRLLKAGGLPDIASLQGKIEESKKPASAALKGVRVTGRVDTASDGPMVKNILGVLRGSGPHAGEFIVIGGHYDHLGKNPPMFRPNDPAAIHNGADDNASGSGAVIECAKLMAAGPKPERSILFMTFTAEEEGLLGSQYWTRHPTIPLEQAVAMINMDMVGRLRKNILEVGGMRTGDGLEDLTTRLCKQYGFDLRDGGGGRGPSDHSSFYGKNIPVLFLFTGLHKQYHQPTDDVELINAEGGAKVSQLAVDMAYEIAAMKARPAFHKDARSEPMTNPDREETQVAEGKDAPAGNGERGSRFTRGMPAASMHRLLGIYPDTSDTEETGVLVADVIDNSPAARAGIDKGDRLLTIDGKKVDDLDSLRIAIDAVKGDAAKIVLKREGRQQTLMVSFAPAKAAAPKAAAARKPAGKPKSPNPHPDNAEQSQEMPTARLGIAPSYGDAEGKEGYGIEFVVAVGPAAKAGMKDSDRIISIGGRKIKDIGTYMAAMSHFKPGQEVVVLVLREGKQVELKVKLEGSKPRGNE